MKRTSKAVLIVIIIIVIATFAGCFRVNPMRLIEEDSVRADVDNIMDAIEAKDNEYIYDTYFNNHFLDFDKVEIDEGVSSIIESYEGKREGTELYNVSSYTFNSMKDDNTKKSTKVVTYLIKTTETTYALNVSYMKDSSDNYILVGINLNEYLDYVVNAKFSNYTLKNWLLLSLNIVSFGIMILALILCIKTKIKLKPLWIILILVQVGVSITDFPTMHRVNYSFFQLLGISKYLLYAHGGTITNVFIHIFAIVFLFVRKPLNISYLAQQEMIRERAEKEQKLREEHAAKAAIQNEASSIDNEEKDTI